MVGTPVILTKPTRILVSSLIASTAIVISFATSLLVAIDAFNAVLAHPGDPSSGDGAGWAFVFSLPLLIPLDILSSLFVGLVAFGISLLMLGRYAMGGRISN